MERAAVESRLRAAAFVAADAGLAASRAQTAEALATYQERFGHAA